MPGIKQNVKNDRAVVTFTDFIGAVIKDFLGNDLSKCCYYACSDDESADNSVIEHEMVFPQKYLRS